MNENKSELSADFPGSLPSEISEEQESEGEIISANIIKEDGQLQAGSATIAKNGHYIHCLTIIGQIEGHYILPAQNKTTKY